MVIRHTNRKGAVFVAANAGSIGCCFFKLQSTFCRAQTHAVPSRQYSALIGPLHNSFRLDKFLLPRSLRHMLSRHSCDVKAQVCPSQQ